MAKDIFDKSIFDGYRVESLTESVQDIIPKYNFDGSTKTTVFISHKHDDLDEVKGLIGLLEKNIISRHTLTVGINQCRKKFEFPHFLTICHPKSYNSKYSNSVNCCDYPF